MRRELLGSLRQKGVEGPTFEHGADASPDREAAVAMVLAEGELHEEQRQAPQDQHDAVGNQEGAWGEEKVTRGTDGGGGGGKGRTLMK